MAFVTRFAPSPTGPLHLGHAFSAILAHDMARAAGGRFVLRMEDTDRARCRPEWARRIEDDLHWLGITWDGPVHRQSDRIDAYTARLMTLSDSGMIYPCSCTRADIRADIGADIRASIRATTAAPQEGVIFDIYPGTCRNRAMADRHPGDALRLNLGRAFDHLAGGRIGFRETGPRHAGRISVARADSLAGIGDVVLSRKDEAIVAYFLASVLDDADQEITHVIRGEDLFAYTPVQVILQQLFALETPVYHHHALVRDEAGRRLAKRDDARAIATYRAEGATPADIRHIVGLAPDT